MAITLLRHFHLRRNHPLRRLYLPWPPPVPTTISREAADWTSTQPAWPPPHHEGTRVVDLGVRWRGEREIPRSSRGREKAGENGGPGMEERARGQHPRSPPHRSILCPPPCTGELAPSLSSNHRAQHASSLLFLTALLRTPVAHDRCRVLRAHSVSLFSLSLPPSRPFLLSPRLPFSCSLLHLYSRLPSQG